MKLYGYLLFCFVFCIFAPNSVLANPAFEEEVVAYVKIVDQAINQDFFSEKGAITNLTPSSKLFLANIVQEYYDVFKRKSFEYSHLHHVAFEQLNGKEKGDTKLLYFLEMQLKYSINQVLSLLANFKSTPNASLVELAEAIRSVTEKLNSDQTIVRSKTEMLPLVLPFKAGSLHYIFKFLLNSILNKPLAGVLTNRNSLPLMPKSKSSIPILTYFSSEGVSSNRDSIVSTPANVVAVAFNHDHAAFDAYYFYQFVESHFGAKNHQIHILTTKAAWIQYSLYDNRFSNIHLIEDPLFVKKLISQLSTLGPEEKAYFLFAPEGGQTTWDAQFPTIAKPGGFSIAQKLKKAGLNVAYVEAQTNLAEFVSNSTVPFKIDVYGPEPVGDNDWVTMARNRFQTRLQKYRGQIMDLLEPQKIPGSRIYKLTPKSLTGACNNFYSASKR